MRSTRPITFAADLNLHTFVENEIGPMMDCSSVDERKYSKKQKILMNVLSPSAMRPSLTKHENGHGCIANDSTEDYNDIEWSWLDGADDDVHDGDDVDSIHGKCSMRFIF